VYIFCLFTISVPHHAIQLMFVKPIESVGKESISSCVCLVFSYLHAFAGRSIAVDKIMLISGLISPNVDYISALTAV